MDIANMRGKAKAFFKKYRYVMLVLVLGIGLMALPTKSNTTNVASVEPTQNQDFQNHQEELAQILGAISGVGEVEVLLTLESSAQSIYQTDNNTNQQQTVIVTDGNRQQSGLLRYEASPKYRGAIVVCQGGDQSSVKLAVTAAVASATGLRADQICVLKMK